MTSDLELRAARRSRCSSSSIATSTPPSRTCRPRSTRRRTSCRARSRRRRRTARRTPPTRRSSRSSVGSRHAPAPAGQRLRRLDPRAEDLAGLRRRSRHARRRAEAGGARAGRSGARSRARASRSRTCARAIVAANVNQAEGQHRRPAAATTRSRRTISSRRRDVVPADRHRLQERRARAPLGRRDVVDGVENAELAAWANGERARHPQRAAPARRERHRGRRSREGAPAAAHGVAAARHRREDPQRPHRDRARVGRGRRDHARDHDRPRRRSSSSLFLRNLRATVIPASPCRSRSSARSA